MDLRAPATAGAVLYVRRVGLGFYRATFGRGFAGVEKYIESIAFIELF